jgi:hypothetical protein
MKRYWDYIEYHLIQLQLYISRFVRMRRLKRHDPSIARDRKTAQEDSDNIYPLW